MKPDEFEPRLQRISRRDIPSTWREEILTTAQNATSPAPAARRTPHGLFAALIQSLTALPRPQRLAWSTLGLLWLAIGLLHWSAPHDPAISTGQPNSLALQQFRQQQIQLLADLQSPTPVRPQPKLPPPPPSAPGPRSERRVATPTYC